MTTGEYAPPSIGVDNSDNSSNEKTLPPFMSSRRRRTSRQTRSFEAANAFQNSMDTCLGEGGGVVDAPPAPDELGRQEAAVERFIVDNAAFEDALGWVVGENITLPHLFSLAH